jgi:hypothetical protein
MFLRVKVEYVGCSVPAAVHVCFFVSHHKGRRVIRNPFSTSPHLGHFMASL